MTDDALTDGTLALEARRIALAAGERGPEVRAAAGETFVYVIAGSGTAGGAPLGPESVAWLEPGDVCVLEAGPDGLEILLAHAP